MFSSAGDGNTVIGPTYVAAPELTVAAGVPRGTVVPFSMSSANSTIYTGSDVSLAAQNKHAFTRGVWVYLPAGYVPGTPLPVMVVQDGGDFYQDFQPVLDNLIAAKRIPALVGVFVNSGGGDSFGSERGLEYDPRATPTGPSSSKSCCPPCTANCNARFLANIRGRAPPWASAPAARQPSAWPGINTTAGRAC